MKKRLMLIDGNNLAHRAYSKFPLNAKDGTPSGMIFGFFYILKPLIVKLSPDGVIVVFDGGSNPYRKAILPGYRVREGLMPQDRQRFYNQRRVVMNMLASIGLPYCQEKAQEADDIIYSLIRKYPKDYITIVSSDKDFIPLLSPMIKVFNPFRNKLITIANCEEVYGYPPNQFRDYLILKGDSSDKIPGVRGMGDVRIREFLQEYGSIEDWIDSPNKGKWVKYPIEEVYARNLKLISLPYFYFKVGKKLGVNLQPARWDLVYFRKVCQKYDIHKITTPEFLSTFEKLYKNEGFIF